MHDTIPETCDKCGCTPTVDPETDVIDLIQVCGITLGVQLDREHWLCSTCAAEFGGGTGGDDDWALDRLSILVTALQCFAGGESPGQVAAFGRPAWEQDNPAISHEDLTKWDIQRMLDALGLTEEQQQALDNR